jgi:hypothetical protein
MPRRWPTGVRGTALSLVLVCALPLPARAQSAQAPSAPSDDKPAAEPSPTPADLPPPTPVAPDAGHEGKAAASDLPAPPAGGFSPFFNPAVGHFPFRADYRATWFPDEPVTGQPTHLGYVEQNLSFSFPLWQNATDEMSAAVHVCNELFNTQAVLPDTHQPFPDELWNIHLSTTYRHLFDNGWIGGGTVSVGSASDKPFEGIKEMTAGINAFLRVPQGEHNAWLFSLAYSSNSQLPIPIPGVAYVWMPNEYFHANIGLPFLVMYRPWEDLTLDFSYMLLTNVHARATYRVSAPLRIYAGYDWLNESYLLADRVNTDDRFFYYDQRLTGGVQYFFNRHASLDLCGGYVFDRFYFEGQSLSDDHHNRIDVGNGPFLSLQTQIRW